MLTPESQQALGEDLTANGVSTNTWQTMSEYIKRYNDENQSEPVKSDWTESPIGEDIHQFVTFMDLKEYQEKMTHFTNDINCRHAAFILMNELIQAPDSIEQLGLASDPEFQDLTKRHFELGPKQEQLYSFLFGSNPEYQSTEDMISAWKEVGIQFPESIKLVSAVQNEPGNIQHMHVTIAFEKDGQIHLFEKVDPTQPYRISQFHSWTDLKEHWLSHRFQVFGDSVDILVNDHKI